MTFSGWFTIFAFVGILTALALPLGRYMAAVYTGERTFLDPVMRYPERFAYRLFRVDPHRGQNWKSYAKSVIFFSLAGWLFCTSSCAPRVVELHRTEPAAFCVGALECDLQYGLVVPHQHQLAVLRRRDDDELLQPDGWAHGAELCLRGRRHRGSGGADPRDRQARE